VFNDDLDPIQWVVREPKLIEWPVDQWGRHIELKLGENDGKSVVF
jgi:hypothetical protein